MSKLTWDDVLNNESLIGVDIEALEDGSVYRGPLREIERDGDLLRFHNLWCAYLRPITATWHVHDIATLSFTENLCEPIDMGDGRIHFIVPLIGSFTIFPKEGSKLDPAKVENLVLPS